MRRVAVGFVLMALLWSASAAAQPTGRLLVSLEPAADGRAQSAATARATIARHGADVQESVPQVGLVAVAPHPGESLAALRRRLAADPHVRAISAEHRAEPR